MVRQGVCKRKPLILSNNNLPRGACESLIKARLFTVLTNDLPHGTVKGLIKKIHLSIEH